MTTQLRNLGESTEFSDWLRKQESIDSKLGYVTTNIDYVWQNYKTGKWFFLEEKRFGNKDTEPSFSQKKLFEVVHNACINGDKNYIGFNLVVFEKSNPENGKIWINHIESTKDELLKLLKFV